jgi:hypothetical protein
MPPKIIKGGGGPSGDVTSNVELDGGLSDAPRKKAAIVSKEIWDRAQEVLRSNRIMAKRNGRIPFLLRGLIKCGLCGLTFSGSRASARQPDHYYHCNGRQFARGLYGLSGKKCSAKSINGRDVERVVWADIESFLRDPVNLERLRGVHREGDELQALRSWRVSASVGGKTRARTDVGTVSPGPNRRCHAGST